MLYQKYTTTWIAGPENQQMAAVCHYTNIFHKQKQHKSYLSAIVLQKTSSLLSCGSAFTQQVLKKVVLVLNRLFFLRLKLRNIFVLMWKYFLYFIEINWVGCDPVGTIVKEAGFKMLLGHSGTAGVWIINYQKKSCVGPKWCQEALEELLITEVF